jgi:hypothetical protein
MTSTGDSWRPQSISKTARSSAIMRQTSPTDGRSFLLALTPEGETPPENHL